MRLRSPLFRFALGLALALTAVTAASAQEIKGSVLEPTPANLDLTWRGAQVVLPAGAAGPEIWQGKLADLPAVSGRWPVAVVMHGSSGVAGFITEYQRWLAAELKLASVAPDSLAIPDRLTYKSPVAIEVYERVHALRAAELANALKGLRGTAWADAGHLVVIGTSEGSVPVARSADPDTAGRILYAWSCEKNYFVASPDTAIPTATPVLNAIASRDPYFSRENPWNAGVAIDGSCAAALKSHTTAAVYLTVSDKHTIINQEDVRGVTAAFLRRVLGR